MRRQFLLMQPPAVLTYCAVCILITWPVVGELSYIRRNTLELREGYHLTNCRRIMGFLTRITMVVQAGAYRLGSNSEANLYKPYFPKLHIG